MQFLEVNTGLADAIRSLEAFAAGEALEQEWARRGARALNFVRKRLPFNADLLNAAMVVQMLCADSNVPATPRLMQAAKRLAEVLREQRGVKADHYLILQL